MRMLRDRDHELIYALDDLSGKMVYIEDIPEYKRGLACGCICPKCRTKVVAKLGHDVPHGKRPHFAHQKGVDCQGANMTVLHQLAEDILKEEKSVMFPEYKRIPAKTISFVEVEIEQRNDRPDLQPDIVGITEDGLRWHIEIRNTSEVKEPKIEKIISSEISCLEIDVREHVMDRKEALKDFLIKRSYDREWLNNPNYEKKIRDVLSRINSGQFDVFVEFRNNRDYEVKPAYLCYGGCKSTDGKCIYQKDKENVDGIEFIICDVAQIERDDAVLCQPMTHSNETIDILDNETVNDITPESQTFEEIMENSEHTLLYDTKGKTIEEIALDLKNDGVVNLGGDVKGEIIMCEKIKGLNGIALMFRCKELNRVSPIQVYALGIDSDELRYIIIRCCKEKNIKFAEKDYYLLKDSYQHFSRELFEDNNGEFLIDQNNLPF